MADQQLVRSISTYLLVVGNLQQRSSLLLMGSSRWQRVVDNNIYVVFPPAEREQLDCCCWILFIIPHPGQWRRGPATNTYEIFTYHHHVYTIYMLCMQQADFLHHVLFLSFISLVIIREPQVDFWAEWKRGRRMNQISEEPWTTVRRDAGVPCHSINHGDSSLAIAS